MSEYDVDGICTASKAALAMAEKYVTVESDGKMAELMIGQYVFKVGTVPAMNAVADLIQKIVATAIDEHATKADLLGAVDAEILEAATNAAYERGKAEERARVLGLLARLRVRSNGGIQNDMIADEINSLIDNATRIIKAE